MHRLMSPYNSSARIADKLRVLNNGHGDLHAVIKMDTKSIPNNRQWVGCLRSRPYLYVTDLKSSRLHVHVNKARVVQ